MLRLRGRAAAGLGRPGEGLPDAGTRSAQYVPARSALYARPRTQMAGETPSLQPNMKVAGAHSREVVAAHCNQDIARIGLRPSHRGRRNRRRRTHAQPFEQCAQNRHRQARMNGLHCIVQPFGNRPLPADGAAPFPVLISQPPNFQLRHEIEERECCIRPRFRLNQPPNPIRGFRAVRRYASRQHQAEHGRHEIRRGSLSAFNEALQVAG